MSGLSDFFNGIFGMFSPKKPAPTPAPSPTPTPKPQGITEDQIKQGLLKFAPNTPLATESGALAEASTKLPKNVDPLLPAVVALMETRGGLDNQDSKKKTGKNNFFNLFGTQNGVPRKLIDYPDIRTSIVGGDNQGVKSKGFVGTINEHPSYEAFRKSGNLEDFFIHYTPPGEEHGNPEMSQLLERYQQLRDLFVIQQAVSKDPRVQTLQKRAEGL
jgi:hypothetical protein